MDSKRVLLHGKVSNGLYRLSSASSWSPRINVSTGRRSSSVSLPATCFTVSTPPTLWHLRLGHPSPNVLKHVLINEKCFVSSVFPFCSSCQLGKAHHKPYNISPKESKHALDLIHSDIWGPCPVLSRHGCRYYIHFLDNYSCFTWIYPLRTKSEAFPVFNSFQALVERQFSTKIKMLQTDRG